MYEICTSSVYLGLGRPVYCLIPWVLELIEAHPAGQRGMARICDDDIALRWFCGFGCRSSSNLSNRHPAS